MAWLPAGEGGSQLNPRRLTCRVPQPDTPMSDPRTTPVSPAYSSTRLNPLAALIFSSRWLQLPLYLGLILAQGVYVVLFMKELWHLVHGATELSEQLIMLAVLGLIRSEEPTSELQSLMRNSYAVFCLKKKST